MPLQRGKSKKAVGNNVREMMHSKDQAVAIALKEAQRDHMRKSKGKRS